ncbi:chromosome segregation DNA-binding protein [Streptomyces zhaozhouensis]|uniref:Chromosome segregation DNA-binding protein n=1 Tax=Streptomyces zhaozhouensis TaxID=1300267 RepID=A0A286DYM1_9ACTN|nr:ParB/RepB/Spo0J family partition protein [Streptomyces zhaozhouensis]SOD63756.1 chromosome segregation DNA-binding protein [Streptomyces zhaozhouensis]
MSDRRRGLGRGLGALIPAAPQSSEDTETDKGSAVSPSAVPLLTAERGIAVPTGPAAERERRPVAEGTSPEPADAGAEQPQEVSGAHFAELPLDAITPNPRQPREVFDEDALSELVTSIKEVGLLQPVVVRRLSADRYELIMGERRWRACREAGLEAIPAIVRATEDDKMLLDALLENLHRAQLNPLEEAAAYDQLLRDFKCTHDELADRIGRSRPQVSNTLRLLRLSPAVQRRVAAGVLSAGHARALLSVEDAEEQNKLALRIVAEGLSVRAVEEIVTLQSDSKKSTRARGPRAGKRIAPALDTLAHRLSDRFETRVKVDLGQKKGKIVVEFASIEDLERILGQLAPGEGPVMDSSSSPAPEQPEQQSDERQGGSSAGS